MNSAPMRRQDYLILGGFTLLYMLLSVAFALNSGNSEFVFYIVVMVVLITAVMFVHARVGLSRGVLWALSLWGLVHMAGGLTPVPETWPYEGENAVLYSLWLIPHKLKYDQLVHAYGFGVTTQVCWQAMARGYASIGGSKLRPTLGNLTLCAAAGMGFGALNELVEFVATLTIPNTNVGGYINTGWDLVSNLVGCVFSALLLRIREK